MKRMIHPDHGAHHAMNTIEEAQMRANGWTAEDDAPADKVEPLPSEEKAAKRTYTIRAKKD